MRYFLSFFSIIRESRCCRCEINQTMTCFARSRSRDSLVTGAWIQPPCPSAAFRLLQSHCCTYYHREEPSLESDCSTELGIWRGPHRSTHATSTIYSRAPSTFRSTSTGDQQDLLASYTPAAKIRAKPSIIQFEIQPISLEDSGEIGGECILSISCLGGFLFCV